MRILVVDDHPLVRTGISTTLSFEDDINKVIEASNVREAVNMIHKEKPDLAIVDLNLGSEDGLDIVKGARGKGTKTKFLILTSSVKKEDYMRSEETNVDGYILKEAFAEDILYAIKVVLRGRHYIDPEIMRYQNTYSTQDASLSELTPRESDVLAELGNCLSNYEIAQKLFISENTVKKHVGNIFSKLDITHRTQAALLVNRIS